MLHCRQIKNHCPSMTRRGHVEMSPVTSKTRMAMSVDVRAEWICLQKLQQRTAPNLRLTEAGIENAKRRTVRNKDSLRVEQLRQSFQVALDLGSWFLKLASHERERVLVANESKLPGLDLPALERL